MIIHSSLPFVRSSVVAAMIGILRVCDTRFAKRRKNLTLDSHLVKYQIRWPNNSIRQKGERESQTAETYCAVLQRKQATNQPTKTNATMNAELWGFGAVQRHPEWNIHKNNVWGFWCRLFWWWVALSTKHNDLPRAKIVVLRNTTVCREFVSIQKLPPQAF